MGTDNSNDIDDMLYKASFNDLSDFGIADKQLNVLQTTFRKAKTLMNKYFK